MKGEQPTTTRLLLPALCLGFAAPAAAQIRFADIASSAGVHHVVRNSESPDRYQIEPMIAGVALFDYDNDGRLDLYFCNGARVPGLEKSDASFSNRLYRNGPGLEFKDVSERAGVAGAGFSMGVAAGDYDNDGWTDLYVTGVNRNILYRNRGDGTFEDVTSHAGVSGELTGHGKAWAVGAGWFDYDNDGNLDLFVVNYCVWSVEKDRRCGAPKAGYRTYCHPDMYASPTTTPTGGWTSSSRTTRGATSSSATAATAASRRSGSTRGSATSTRGGPSREWGPTSGTTTATGGPTSS
jgi:hypothetical protein